MIFVTIFAQCRDYGLALWRDYFPITKYEAATVLITTTEDDTTVGQVSWVFVNNEFIGTVTIQPGTGELANFHANARIDVLSWQTMDFSFTGSYFVTPWLFHAGEDIKL